MKKIDKNRIISGFSFDGSFRSKENKGYRLALFDNGKGGFHTQWIRLSKVSK